MNERHADGSAGDANYGKIGIGYANYRQPEPRIAAIIWEALRDARTVLNVGAGAGSYEPIDREVTPLEPSESMRAQRPKHLPVAIDGVAEKIPFTDAQFDASMATFTVHQWADLGAGLSEMRRVTRGPVLVLTCDPNKVQDFWLNDYAPEVLTTEARRYPSLGTIVALLGGTAEIIEVPIPLLCRDGFNEAYYGRPEKLLEDDTRLACSAWSFVAQATRTAAVGRLAACRTSKAMLERTKADFCGRGREKLFFARRKLTGIYFPVPRPRFSPGATLRGPLQAAAARFLRVKSRLRL